MKALWVHEAQRSELALGLRDDPIHTDGEDLGKVEHDVPVPRGHVAPGGQHARFVGLLHFFGENLCASI